jgi:hypothetical protein
MNHTIAILVIIVSIVACSGCIGTVGDIPVSQMPNLGNGSISLNVQTVYYLQNMTDAVLPTYNVTNGIFPTFPEQSASATVTSPYERVLLKQFITPIGDPSLTSLVSGTRSWITYAVVNSVASGKITWIDHELYLYHVNGSTTPVYKFQSPPLTTTVERIKVDYVMASDFPMESSDRFIMRYYANSTTTGSRTVTMYYGGTTRVSRIESPIVISGLVGQKMYYVSDSSGGATTRKLTFTNGILTGEV